MASGCSNVAACAEKGTVNADSRAGQIFVPIPAGKKWPLVATADIAAKAACSLLDRGWSWHHRVGVHGPKDLSTDEAAAIISSALGNPVKCVDAPHRAVLHPATTIPANRSVDFALPRSTR
ncbi:MAG TPA: hypothetical protein VG425_15750 [Casimicrobiaceae bacterium]|nr:hypothetical protein [Casimicrobiaceae bacterium]